MDELPGELVRLHRTVHLGDARVRELRIDIANQSADAVLDAEDMDNRAHRVVRLAAAAVECCDDPVADELLDLAPVATRE